MVAERGRREYHAEVRSLFQKKKTKKKKTQRPSPSFLSHTKRMFHVTQPRNANRRKLLPNQRVSVASVKDKREKRQDLYLF